MKCSNCGKSITKSATYCPSCGCPVTENAKNQYDKVTKKKEIIKKAVLLVFAVAAMIFAVALNIPDPLGITLLEKLGYISVDIKIAFKDYDGALDAMGDLSDRYRNSKSWDVYISYISGLHYFECRKYYSAYHMCFDKIRDFKDVDKYYNKPEYTYANFGGGWRMYNSQIGTDFYLWFDGADLTVVFIEGDDRAEAHYFLEADGNNIYNMIRDDGDKSYYLVYDSFNREWAMYERGSNDPVGYFSKMDDGY